MRPEWWFPIALSVMELGAAVVYLGQDDWRRGVYWLAAFVITVVITW